MGFFDIKIENVDDLDPGFLRFKKKFIKLVKRVIDHWYAVVVGIDGVSIIIIYKYTSDVIPRIHTTIHSRKYAAELMKYLEKKGIHELNEDVMPFLRNKYATGFAFYTISKNEIEKL